MLRYYTITLGNDSNLYKFVYELESHRPAQEWAKIIQVTKPSTLRQNFNPWQGLPYPIEEKIAKLKYLVESLNIWLPDEDKINWYWNNNEKQKSLNKLHVHFPKHEKNETDVIKLSQLSEYNDLIHEIEDILRKNPLKETIWLLLLPDLGQEVELLSEDYKHFHPDRFFGELCLHYPHVGRHPLELLKARDFSCPIEQIIPQRLITSYHSLRFYDDFSLDNYNHWFLQFYKKSTLQQVFDINDPKLAFGHITLGKLLTVDNNVCTKDEILSIVKTTNKVVHWNIN